MRENKASYLSTVNKEPRKLLFSNLYSITWKQWSQNQYTNNHEDMKKPNKKR